MTATHRVFGSELSPYSTKVRSYFRYKQIPHEWIIRSMDKMAEFQKYAKLPLVPLVVTPEGEGVQDSTPIIERFEKEHPDPSIHPGDPVSAFLSFLIEEYADEWGNKPMFHYRWFYESDQESAARRIAIDQAGGALGKESPNLGPMVEMIKKRMVPRLSFVGSTPQTKDVIEDSYRRQLEILEKHLAGGRPYLFGGRPALSDFGLSAQLYQCWSDPTPGALMRERAPHVERWTQRMLNPKDEGPFEPWESLSQTLFPLFRDEVGAVFLPWSDANAKALAGAQSEFAVQLGGKSFSQQPQKYHAKSLGVLRRRYAEAEGKDQLDPILEEAGCLSWLRQG